MIYFKSMQAVILAGGKGERLRPTTNTLPKPMVKINGKPLLFYIIADLKRYGIKDIIITVCYRADIIKNYFGNGENFDVNISYITEQEDKPLGTAGALILLKGKIKNTFIVSAGDILRKLDVQNVLSFHKKKGGLITICVYKNINPNPKSIITFNEERRILQFVERPEIKPKNAVWSNASFYIFEPAIFSFIPKGGKTDFGKDIFSRLVKAQKPIYAYLQNNYFLDIGDIEKVKQANEDILKGKYKF